MAGNAIAVDAATQTSDLESDNDSFSLQELPNVSPRVVIDTSPPFLSVEEAVIRFGGRGFWIPGSILPHDDFPATIIHQQEPEVSDINKLEEKTVAMSKDIQFKEQETEDILKELDLTKRLVEELKLRHSTESPEFISSPPCLHCDKESNNDEHSERCVSLAVEMIMSELQQTNLNLHQNTNELTAIRASVESLGKKMDGKGSIEKVEGTHSQNSKYLAISRELRELNYEADQFMKTAEAAKSVALPETTNHKPARISLSVEEYHVLTEKSRKADRLLKRDIKPKTCLGDILSRKVLEENGGVRRERVSLNQMLSQQREETLTQRRREGDGGRSKGLFSKRRGFDFVHISFPLSKHGKNKIRALNHW